MNADQLPPYRLAQLLRNLANAREQNHPIAVDIAAAGPLQEIDAVLWFDHLRSGNLRCDFRPLPGLPPCTADGFVAVTNPARNNAPIFICCLEHLSHFLTPGQSCTAPVSSNNPLARHYAFSLQAAQRQLRQSPDYDLSLDQQVQSLEGQIKRRLTPTHRLPRDECPDPEETPKMILPNCRRNPQNHANVHHPHCPSVAEPMPSNDTQLLAESACVGRFVAPYVAAEILSRKDADGNPLFPLLSQRIDA